MLYVDTGALFIGIVLTVFTIVVILHTALKSPFNYPYFYEEFDATGRKKPDIDELLEEYINSGGFKNIKEHRRKIQMWKQHCENQIQSSILKNLRRKQYDSIQYEPYPYRFSVVRSQTRYRQYHYQREAYTVENEIACRGYNFEYLQNKYNQLKAINFETTLRKYHTKNQRALMTKELRDYITKRDNYTCQICGKQMFDKVGLQIDHIIPVDKGGKSIKSNLQVLCSVCNGRKSNKLNP